MIQKNSVVYTEDCFFNLISISLELGGLLKFVRPFLISISKAKAARLVRSLLDLFLDMEAATGQEVELCLECIEWAKAEKRTFLRQALEVRKQMPPTIQMQHNLCRIPRDTAYYKNTSMMNCAGLKSKESLF